MTAAPNSSSKCTTHINGEKASFASDNLGVIALHLDQKVDRYDHQSQIGITKKSAKRDQK
ncbi:hypothetical protein N478_26105 [Pseudoalteromonas luteoviolacea S4060-1]|uniref:Uncharacterized protein n=1 Tax=Pseudoalteromonas luteoviolacea S4060-1 TaxID=1365257 RepID=A0A167JBW3_9GAMM|nr:hypothetical protein N478_26105 [Pseudoalteromonas luteoviolacea S4060-1]